MEARRLALDVARDHFGDPAAAVVEALLHRPRQTARSLQITSKQSLKLVRDSLLALVQHNVVSWEEDGTGNILYTAYEGLLLIRLRFASFLLYARSQLGEDVCTLMRLTPYVVNRNNCFWRLFCFEVDLPVHRQSNR